MAKKEKAAEAKKSKAEAKKPRTAKALQQYVATLRGYQPLEWIKTGIPALDLVIGNGIPRARMLEVFGEPGVGKTALTLAVCAAFQRAGGMAVFLDIDCKLDFAWAEARFGVNTEALGYNQPDDIAALVQIMGNVAKTATPSVPTIIVIDNLAPAKEQKLMEKAIKGKIDGNEKAARARELSEGLRAVLMELHKQAVTLWVVNELRASFDFKPSFFGSSVVTPGGKTPKYSSAVRLSISNGGKLTDTTKKVVRGIAVKVMAFKNQCSWPFRKCMLKYRFDEGFVPYSGLDELLIRHNRITVAGEWLRYRDRRFKVNELQSVIAEMPEILTPLANVTENNPATTADPDVPPPVDDDDAAEINTVEDGEEATEKDGAKTE